MKKYIFLLTTFFALSCIVYCLAGNSNANRKLKKPVFIASNEASKIYDIKATDNYDSIFYYLIHKGFRGETIVFGAVLPYILYLCFRIFIHHETRKILWLVMALAVTIPLVYVQRGLLPCVICVVILLLIVLAGAVRKKVKRK